MLKRLWRRMTHRYSVIAKPMGGLPVEVHYKAKPPERTEKMIREGFIWTRTKSQVPDSDGIPDFIYGWTETCLVCGGNCGQCGTSLGMGNPASMDRLIENIT